MIDLSNKSHVFNIAAGVIIAAAAVTFVRTTFARPHVEVCSTRYKKQVSMRLDQNGSPLMPSDVQAMANGHDEGVGDNLRIAQFTQGPAKFAMGVLMATGTSDQRSNNKPGGISLPWTPSTIEQPNAACLSYDVFLPADFDFNNGGTLPGLFGTTSAGLYSDVPRFSSNLAWYIGGAPKLYLETKTSDGPQGALYDTYESVIARGRWVRVDQEVILNAPDQSDGIVRLWLDGKLETDVRGAALRTSSAMTIAGVAGDVYYGGSTTFGKAATDTTVWLSPFEIRWN